VEKRIAIAALLCLAVLAPAQSGKREAFDWFDSLKIDHLDPATFVKVQQWSENKGKRYDQPPVYGFLAGSKDGAFEIVTLGLTHAWFFEKTSATAPWFYGVAGKPTRMDFTKWAKARYAEAKETADTGVWAGQPNDRPNRTEAFLVARLLEKDDPALSASFYNVFATWPTYYGQPAQSPLDAIRGDLQNSLGDEATATLNSGWFSRAEQARQIRWYLDHFPQGRFAIVLASLLPLVERLVVDEGAHHPKMWKDMSGEERIAELVYRLRDQAPAWYASRDDSGVGKDGSPIDPAAALSQIGYPAVPALIAAMTDPAPSRSWPLAFSGPGPILPISIGQVATNVLATISNRHFFGSGETEEARLLDGQKLAQAWWDEASKRGERQSLIDDVRGGKAGAAWRLVYRYPADAEAIIAAALAKTPTAELVSAMGLIPTPSARQTMRETMANGPTDEIRFTAARFVAKTDVDAAIKQIVSDLPGYFAKPRESDYSGLERLQILAASGRPEGMRAVARYFTKMPIGQRGQMVSFFADIHRPPTWYGLDFSNQPPPLADQAAYDEALESFLVSELLDVTVLRGGSGSIGSFQYHDARMADFANYALTVHWPKKYPKANWLSPFDLEAGRIRSLNVWRKEHGQAVQAVPIRPQIARVPTAEIDPFLTRYVNAKTDAERAEAEAAIQAKGLGALEAVQAEAKRRPELAPVAARLANIVREVRVSHDGPVDENLAKLAQAMRGKPLTAQAVRDLILKGAQTGKSSFALSALRDSDGTGIVVTLALSPVGTNGSNYSFSQRVFVDATTLSGMSGGGNGDYCTRPETWTPLQSALTQALRAAPDKTVQLDVDVKIGG